ncbi:hypothetical protein EEH56_10665, partial [Neisseria gonorrhoeae]
DLRFLFLIFCFHGNDGLEVTRNLKKKLCFNIVLIDVLGLHVFNRGNLYLRPRRNSLCPIYNFDTQTWKYGYRRRSDRMRTVIYIRFF